MTGRRHPRRGRNRPGMALIFVLWVLVLLGLAASELVARARAESRRVATLKARAVAQYAAESGVLATTVALQTVLDSASDPIDVASQMRRLDTLGRAASHLVTGEARCAVVVLDLNARLDLARADTAALRGLFAEFVSAGRASAIVAALREQPITRFPELARVSGVDDALALAVAPYVTVGSDAFVNVNSAPEAVLAALPGIGRERARAIVSQRVTAPLASTDALRPAAGARGAVPLEGMHLTVVPTRLMIVSRGWQRGAPVTHEIRATYVLLAGRLTLARWEERER